IRLLAVALGLPRFIHEGDDLEYPPYKKAVDRAAEFLEEWAKALRGEENGEAT
ncbi:hypothetical protein LCGC14_2847610, partial [marine sediment metagenome]